MTGEPRTPPLAESMPIGLRLSRRGVRTLERPRRWRVGRFVLEETTDRELWILGGADLAALDRLPRAMTDPEAGRVGMQGVRSVGQLVALVEETARLWALTAFVTEGRRHDSPV